MPEEMPPGWQNQVPPGQYGQPGYPPFGQPGQPGPYGPPGQQGQPGQHGHPGRHGQPAYLPPPGYGQPGQGGWNVAPAPGGVPLRPLSLGDILNGAVTSARRNPAATFGLSAIVMTLYSVISTIFGRLYTRQLAGIQQTLKNGQQPTTQQLNNMVRSMVTVVLPVGLATIVLGLVLTSVLTGLLSAVIGRGVLGRKIGLAEAWRAGRPAAVIGAAVLLLLLGICVPLPVVVVVVVLALLHLTPAAVLLGVLGGIACVAFEIVLVIRLSLTLPAVILEGLSPVSAIKRSWQLSAGSFWRLLGILLLTAVIVAVAAGVLSIPFTVTEALMAGSSGLLTLSANASVAALIVGAIGSILAATVTRPVSAGVSVLLYVDLRIRREGLDLALRDAAQSQALTGEEFAAAWQRPASGQGNPSPW